jgi:protein O-GlcNAc transferase
MADMLEHMPFPKTGLAAAHRLRRPDGVLFLSMPNMDNMVWRRLQANGVNPYWGEIEHYHKFSRKRLYALLQNHGFRPVEYHISERYRVCMEVIAVKQG